MATRYLLCQTLTTDVPVIEEINATGEPLNPSKGECAELTGVLLEIAD